MPTSLDRPWRVARAQHNPSRTLGRLWKPRLATVSFFSVPMIFEYYMHNVHDVQDVSPSNRTAPVAQNLDQHFPGKKCTP